MSFMDNDLMRNQLDNVNIGGPPLNNYPRVVDNLQVTDCNTIDQDIFNQVQRSVECACSSETGGGLLCDAINAGKFIQNKPMSCMIDLLNNYCGKTIPAAKRQEAFKAFSEVTGYKPADLNTIFTTFDDNLRALVNFNAFYMFAPTLILLLIIIWMMVGFKWMNWVLGLFFTVLVIVILYGFSIGYRVHFITYLDSRTQTIENATVEAQNSFENSIAYWPQGLFSAACAVTCDDGNCWSCRPTPAPTPGSNICPCPDPVENGDTPNITKKSRRRNRDIQESITQRSRSGRSRHN